VMVRVMAPSSTSGAGEGQNCQCRDSGVGARGDEEVWPHAHAAYVAAPKELDSEGRSTRFSA